MSADAWTKYRETHAGQVRPVVIARFRVTHASFF